MEISACSPSVAADATSKGGQNSSQSPSVCVDAASEWEVPFLSAHNTEATKPQNHREPQNTAPGQELSKQRTGETGGREETDDNANTKLN